MPRSLLLASAAILAAALALAGWSLLHAEAPPGKDKPGDEPKVRKAYAFTLEDQDGNKVIFSSFQRKIVVLEWMNPDCPFSKRHYERGTFKNLYQKYRNRKKGMEVVWLAINSSHYGTRETNKKFAEEHGVPYPILDDHLGRVGRGYAAKTTPHIFIKAPDGSIVYEGAIDNDPEGALEEPVNYVEKALEELLTGQGVSEPLTKPYGTSVQYIPRP